MSAAGHDISARDIASLVVLEPHGLTCAAWGERFPSLRWGEIHHPFWKMSQ